MEMKGGEVILPLDEQLCLLLYTFSPSPVSAILEILIVLCSLAATASLLILLFTPICPWLKVGRQSLWRWGEPTSEKILRTWSVAVAVFLKKTSPHIRTTGEGEASEERSERMKVLARDVWTTSWLWRTQSHQRRHQLVCLPHRSLADVALASVGRKHTFLCAARYEGKEGPRDLQIASLPSLLSRSSGSL